MPRTDEVALKISASPVRVFKAFLDAEAVARWLPPDGMEAHVDELDPKPGGAFRVTLTYTDPPASGGKSSLDSDVVDARFVEIDPGVCVVMDVTFVAAGPAIDSVMRMTWTVAVDGTGSLVTFSAENVPDAIPQDQHIAGLSQSLRNLADVVA